MQELSRAIRTDHEPWKPEELPKESERRTEDTGREAGYNRAKARRKPYRALMGSVQTIIEDD